MSESSEIDEDGLTNRISNLLTQLKLWMFRYCFDTFHINCSKGITACDSQGCKNLDM